MPNLPVDDAAGATIYPTHTCFDDALELVETWLKEDRSLIAREDIFLVHAIMQAPDGAHYAHAWCERDGRVWLAGFFQREKIYWSAEVQEYYEQGHPIIESTKYTLRRACEENYKWKTFGPWVDRYVALCGTDKRTWA